jgi:hypothetical protein
MINPSILLSLSLHPKLEEHERVLCRTTGRAHVTEAVEFFFLKKHHIARHKDGSFTLLKARRGAIRTEDAREARHGVRRRHKARRGGREDLPAGVEQPLHRRPGKRRRGLLAAAADLLGRGAALVGDGGGRELHPGPGLRHLAPSDLNRHNRARPRSGAATDAAAGSCLKARRQDRPEEARQGPAARWRSGRGDRRGSVYKSGESGLLIFPSIGGGVCSRSRRRQRQPNHGAGKRGEGRSQNRGRRREEGGDQTALPVGCSIPPYCLRFRFLSLSLVYPRPPIQIRFLAPNPLPLSPSRCALCFGGLVACLPGHTLSIHRPS